MLLRKRAWDMMREDFPRLGENDSLGRAVEVLRQAMKQSPENHTAAVLRPNGALAGMISIWDVLRAMERLVLKRPEVRATDETDWDHTFARACALCVHTGLAEHINEDATLLRPSDSLLLVLEKFLKNQSGFAVVEEGGRVIGMVYAGDVFAEIARDMARAL